MFQQRQTANEFHVNNAKFWDSLRLQLRHVPTQLPIESFFCQGFGKHLFELGECIQQTNWTNQLAQEPQANCNTQQIDCSDALIGGSCLLLTDLREPILRLKCKWTGDLFVVIVLKHKSTDKAFQLDRNLMVLGHGSNSISFGTAQQLRWDFTLTLTWLNLVMFERLLSIPVGFRWKNSIHLHVPNRLLFFLASSIEKNVRNFTTVPSSSRRRSRTAGRST